MHHRQRGKPPADRRGAQSPCLAILEIRDNLCRAGGQSRSAYPETERRVAGKVIGQRLDAGGCAGLEALAVDELVDGGAVGDAVPDQRGELGDPVDCTPSFASGQDAFPGGQYGDDLVGHGLRGHPRGKISGHGWMISRK